MQKKNSLPIHSERKYLILLGTALNGLGKIYMLLDEYGKAIEFLQDSYDRIVNLLGDKHEIVGICANNLGLAYAYNKDFENSLNASAISINNSKG